MSIPLDQFEQVCSHFYAARSTAEQKEAEKTLLQFAELPDILEKCQYLLQNSQSPYSLHMAASTMRRHISSSKADSIPSQQLNQIRQFLLAYLSSRPKQVNFVHQALLELVARLTRSCWLESSRGTNPGSRLTADGERSSPPPLSSQTLVEELSPTFFGNTMDPWKMTLGVQILVAICQEINSLNEDLVSGRIYSAVDGLDPQLGQRTLAQLRRVIYWCRDHELFDMFRLALRLARTYVEGVQTEHGVLTGLTALSLSLPPRVMQRASDESQATLVVSALKLLATTLSFDFTQSFSEECSDDLITVQLPSSWRNAILDPDPLELFQDVYSYAVLSNGGNPSGSVSEIPHLVVSNLVLFASIRRSLFTTAFERSKYISRILSLIKSILTHPEPLSNSNTHLEFCRSLARLKSNFQLTELLRAGLPPQQQQPSITLSGEEFSVALPDLNEAQPPSRSPIYSDVLSLIADFSVSTLMQVQEGGAGAAAMSASQGRARGAGKSGESSANSLYFLLSFWNRLVSSLTYLRNQEPVSGHHLEVFAPKVFEAFCRGRKAAVESASNRARAAAVSDDAGGVPIDSGLDDPLEDHTSLYQQMDFV